MTGESREGSVAVSNRGRFRRDWPESRRRKFRQAAFVYLHVGILYEAAALAMREYGLLPARFGPPGLYLVLGAVITALVFAGLYWAQNEWVARVIWGVQALRLPSLEERREDIAELAAYFCEQVSEKHKLPRVELSRGACRALETAAWPRNVRQLTNCIEKGLIACVGGGGQQIEVKDLFPEMAAEELAGPVTLQSGTQRFQAQLLRDTLADVGWNVSEAARRLDISHAHIHRLLKAFGIERERR